MLTYLKIFSIVVLTYNSENFIKPCLDSVFNQKCRDFEVIVVDNGSNDSTIDTIKKDYPDVILIENKQNLGASKARNQGIDIAKYEWVLTLDSDVMLEESFLLDASDLINALPAKVGAFQPKILCSDKKTIYSCGIYLSWSRRFYDIGKGADDIGQHNNAREIFGACSAAAFYRRNMLNDIKEETGYFDERFFFLVEDVDLAWRARKRGWRALFRPELRSYHTGNSSSTNSKMRQYLCFRNRFYMIVRNQGWKSYALRVLPLLFYDLPRRVYLFISNPYCRKEFLGTPLKVGVSPFSGVPLKKKILLFNSGSLLYGSEKGLLNIIKALSSDYDITVVLPESGPLARTIRRLGIKVKIFPLSILSFSFSPFYCIKFFLLGIADIIYFYFYAKIYGADIIYTNNALIIFPSFLAALLKKTHIWHIREFFHIRFANKALSRIIKRFSARIICQSENIRKTLFPATASHITTIYEPAPLKLPRAVNGKSARDKLNISQETIVMSIVSRIHPHKGQYEFIKSMSAFLSQKDSDTVLLLAGDISPRNLRTYLYKKKIERAIKKNNLQKKVLLLGFVKDVRAIFESTDLAIFPIRRNEPFGIALLEALTFSCQVFVSPNPGFDEIISFFKTPYNKLHPKVLSDIIKNRDIIKREPDLPKAFLFKTYNDKMLILMKGVS